MKVIVITNQKGGVGKTSTAIELASLFGEEYRTLVIDLDAQRNMSRYSGADLTKPGVLEALNDEADIQDCIQHLDRYDIMVSSKKLSNAQLMFSEPDSIFILNDVLDEIRANKETCPEIVIVDTPPGRGMLLYMSYLAADYIVAVAECDDGSAEGIDELYLDLKRFASRNQCHAIFAGIILNKFEKTGMHQVALEDLSEVAQDYGAMMFTPVRKSIAVTKAKSVSMPVTKFAPRVNASLDFRKVYEELCDVIKKNEKQ